MPQEPKSRLDRELDEILQKKAKEPVNLLAYRQARRNPNPQPSWMDQARRIFSILMSIPIGLAWVLAFFAWASRDVSPLLTLLFSAAAVAVIWVPGLLNLRGPRSPQAPPAKYWRGRAYTSTAKDVISRSPVDSLKRYFDRRR